MLGPLFSTLPPPPATPSPSTRGGDPCLSCMHRRGEECAAELFSRRAVWVFIGIVGECENHREKR